MTKRQIQPLVKTKVCSLFMVCNKLLFWRYQLFSSWICVSSFSFFYAALKQRQFPVIVGVRMETTIGFSWIISNVVLISLGLESSQAESTSRRALSRLEPCQNTHELARVVTTWAVLQKYVNVAIVIQKYDRTWDNANGLWSWDVYVIVCEVK